MERAPSHNFAIATDPEGNIVAMRVAGTEIRKEEIVVLTLHSPEPEIMADTSLVKGRVVGFRCIISGDTERDSPRPRDFQILVDPPAKQAGERGTIDGEPISVFASAVRSVQPFGAPVT